MTYEGESCMENKNLNQEIPFWCKLNLTIKETAAYSGIGINKLEELVKDPDCKFVLWKGSHKLIKRKQFEEYNDRLKAI